MNTGLEGRWHLVRAEHAGEEAPDLVTERTTIELVDGSYSVRFGGNIVDSGTFELGGVVGALTMILRGSAGPNAGRTIPCVYQLRGDLLRVCYGFDGLAPTEFSTNAKNQRYLGMYRRA